MYIERVIFFSLIIATVVSNQSVNITSNLLNLANAWATTFGKELWVSGDHVTKAIEVNESFKDAGLQKRDDEKITVEITRDIKNMMEEKISAVKRIMDAAENTAMSSNEEKQLKPEEEEKMYEEFTYYNAKCLNETTGLCSNTSLLTLTRNRHFWNIPVNTDFSAVHVPTDVYDRAPEVIKAIKWSENLNDIFKYNYQTDPSLSWQYFGSSSGFMRQYPAMHWNQTPVDLYDCRTRSWYIEAATSPKDLVILVDSSGSMTGQRRDIARHVVDNILETLGNNDFVNIFTFDNNVTAIEECFQDNLVQANLANVRNFKLKMEKVSTKNIANLSLALVRAFKLLQKYREENTSDEYVGAQCNQAIMLVTDGVSDNFKKIFKEYNWPEENNQTGQMPVRVFTYLIRKEITDIRDTRWMACANRGYYVHLSTLEEVREQVLKYIPVMARPLVLNKTKHPVVWTPIYADITDPKMTDWHWRQIENAEQKRLVVEYRKHKKKRLYEEQDRRFIIKHKSGNGEVDRLQEYKLMTSVSMPVFDRRENATKIANLLGVAGTDVPISEIQKLMNPFKLGVNGYAFVVTNNGYILYHPDLRPVFQGILKPNYNSIDMAEIELVNDGFGPREFNRELLDLRWSVINQKDNGSAFLSVKYHYDDIRRVGQLKRKYYYSPIENSPFTIVVSVPEDYGKYRVHGEVELGLHRVHLTGEAILEPFRGSNWKIHPDWTYCKYLNDTYEEFESPEAEFYHFLNRSIYPGWKWKVKPKLSPDSHFSNSSALKAEKLDKDSYYCDRDLLQSVVYDAKATKFFTQEHSKETKTTRNKDPIAMLMLLLSREEFKEKFGITVSFLATRSGLTRWKDYEPAAKKDHLSFGDIYNRAIDEIWYKRAVEQYYVNKLSFVYSVPFDVGINNETLVTASRAIFHQDKMGNKAPAAVVGYQFRQTALKTLFFNIVSVCPHPDCTTTCASDDLDCFVLDNHGYIVVAENSQHTGRFFGEVRGSVMEMLVEENIYHRIPIYDYQAVCFPLLNPIDPPSPSSPPPSTGSAQKLLSAPFQMLIWSGKWIMVKILVLMAELGLSYSEYVTAYSYMPEEDVEKDLFLEPESQQRPSPPRPTDQLSGMMDQKNENPRDISDITINRTRIESCDQRVDLYLLQPNSASFSKQANGSLRPYVVQPIENTNLILVVVDTLCLLNGTTFPNVPVEITYSTTLNCQKANANLPRRRPKDCISEHELEKNIDLCGLGNQIAQNWYLLAASIIALRAIPFLL